MISGVYLRTFGIKHVNSRIRDEISRIILFLTDVKDPEALFLFTLVLDMSIVRGVFPLM